MPPHAPAAPTSKSANHGCCTCDPRPPREQFPKLAPVIDYLDSLSSRADLSILTKLLNQLSISRTDIAPACIFGTRGYKRNTISSSDWYELLALCWHSADRTPIHDHAGVSCAFRVVEGTGTEIRFQPTPSGLICPVATIAMHPGYVCAAADADIHEVCNMQAPGNDLVTLHIYSPPISKMNTYDFAAPISEECANKYNAAGDHPC